VGFIWRGWANRKFRDVSGTIVVRRDNLHEKTVYSLILDDYPELLQFKKTVIFNVAIPEDESDRK
jgi:hypothetical protein